jgi:hypothetical protein
MKWLLQDGSENDPLITQDCTPFSFPEDVDLLNSLVVHEYMLSDALIFPDPVDSPETTGPLCDESEDFSPLHSPSAPALASMDFMDTSEEQKGPSNGLTDMYCNAEYDLRLSRLCLDLSRQLYLARSRPWDTTILNTGHLESAGEAKGTDGPSLSNCNPFGDVLRSTSEFLAIIQSYGLADRSPPGCSDTHDAQMIHPSKPPLGVIIILNLLSSYLQIIAIYDNLFLRLYELLCGTSQKRSVTDLQTLPGLRLAGFPVQQGNLQTKILIQAIKHQFEMLEKVLGLPAEFRVSDRRDDVYTGLIEDQRAQSLLNAVMNKENNVGSTQVVTENVWGLRALGSLRGNMEKVRLFLET